MSFPVLQEPHVDHSVQWASAWPARLLLSYAQTVAVLRLVSQLKLRFAPAPLVRSNLLDSSRHVTLVDATTKKTVPQSVQVFLLLGRD